MAANFATLIGLLSPAICFLIHIFIYRLFPTVKSSSPQKIAILVVIAGTLSCFVITYLKTSSLPWSYHSAVLGFLFGYTYFHWFNMSETARRIRMLIQYVALGIEPTSQLNATYNAKTIFDNRIVRLEQIGTISKSGEKLKLNFGPLVIATKIVLFWRSLFYPRK